MRKECNESNHVIKASLSFILIISLTTKERDRCVALINGNITLFGKQLEDL